MKAAAFIFSLFLSVFFMGGRLPVYASAFRSHTVQNLQKEQSSNHQSLTKYGATYQATDTDQNSAYPIDVEDNDDDHLVKKLALPTKVFLACYYAFVLHYNNHVSSVYQPLHCYLTSPIYLTQRVLRI